jgi:hypothetical protein
MFLTRTPLPALSLLVALSAAGVGLAWAADPPVEKPRGQRIFVMGHSFHMPIAQPLDAMAKAAGFEGGQLVGTQVLGGSSITQHWEKADNPAKKALAAGEVDVLTVSPSGKTLPDPALEKFAELLLEHNPSARMTVQASWAGADGHRRGGFKNADRDKAVPADLRQSWAPLTNKLRDQVKSVNDKYAEKYKRQVLFMVPVGEAVIRLRQRVVKGEVPGVAKQSDLFRDDLGHGKPPIYILNAYCHYAVIYGRSPVGLPVPDMLKKAELGANTETVNTILQEIAWDAVRGEPMSGVK